MKIKASEIKSAYTITKSPLILQVTLHCGGSDTYTDRQMNDEMEPEAKTLAYKLAGYSRLE